MNITRYITKEVEKRLFQGKVIILYGPRQSGKTTLVHHLLEKLNQKVLLLNGDEADIRELFLKATSTKLKTLTSDFKIVFIDEAQKIPEIGTVLKIFADMLPDIQVIATGSSSFELADKTSEALTGRKYEYHLYPLTFSELVANTNLIEEKRMLEHRLIFGSYPEIVTKPESSRELIKLLAGSYLYKDLLSLDAIRNSGLIQKIVKAIALQIGSEVSFAELAQLTGTNKNTVEKYVEILELAFVIFRLPAYNRNVRNEIKKGKKFYFYDNGIRNAVIGNFNRISTRTDIGALWENYVISELKKRAVYNHSDALAYFWRTTAQQEIDYVEEKQGDFYAYEIKWNPKAKANFSKTFLNNYPVKETKVINSGNIEEFLL